MALACLSASFTIKEGLGGLPLEPRSEEGGPREARARRGRSVRVDEKSASETINESGRDAAEEGYEDEDAEESEGIARSPEEEEEEEEEEEGEKEGEEEGEEEGGEEEEEEGGAAEEEEAKQGAGRATRKRAKAAAAEPPTKRPKGVKGAVGPQLLGEAAGSESDEEGNAQRERRSSHGAAGPANPFHEHRGRILEEDDLLALAASRTRYAMAMPAAGIPRGKWVTNQSSLPEQECPLSGCGLKQRLIKHWASSHPGAQLSDFVSAEQHQFFSLCEQFQQSLLVLFLLVLWDLPTGNSYRDILHTAWPKLGADAQLVDAYLLHIMNHLLKTRDEVTKNNEKKLLEEEGTQDQGFTRPKVLILLPFRSLALKLIERFVEIAPPSQKTTVEEKDRFFDDFGVEEVEGEAVGEKALPSELAADHDRGDEDGAASLMLGRKKPLDHTALFKGNNDDHFRIGIKLTRRSIKLYTDFYISDIIVASPIGLITRIGEASSEKDKDVDFLSSIEILVVGYADVILMQRASISFRSGSTALISCEYGNGEYLNGWAKHYRQTIVHSAYADAGLNALFQRTCMNHAGKVKLHTEHAGLLSKVVPQVQQVYERLDSKSLASVDDARLEHFAKQVYPRVRDSLQVGTLIFVRSYFDFVRLRNFLKAQNASFCLLSEYTKQSDISRSRSWFFHSKRSIMLYTERAHFYHRYRLRGIQELIFYSLPDNAHFYAELLNLLEGAANPRCTVLFTKFDKLQVERIVGSTRASRLLHSENRTFMFC
eukprot:SM000203S06156  [mRNA]  locus=s203:172171:178779:- [translate_table: standard]